MLSVGALLSCSGGNSGDDISTETATETTTTNRAVGFARDAEALRRSAPSFAGLSTGDLQEAVGILCDAAAGSLPSSAGLSSSVASSTMDAASRFRSAGRLRERSGMTL